VALPPVRPAPINGAAPDERDGGEILPDDQRRVSRLRAAFPAPLNDRVVGWVFAAQQNHAGIEVQRDLAAQKQRAGDIAAGRHKHGAAAALSTGVDCRLERACIKRLPIAKRPEIAHIRAVYVAHRPAISIDTRSIRRADADPNPFPIWGREIRGSDCVQAAA
jgi:hypothetical protein